MLLSIWFPNTTGCLMQAQSLTGRTRASLNEKDPCCLVSTSTRHVMVQAMNCIHVYLQGCYALHCYNCLSSSTAASQRVLCCKGPDAFCNLTLVILEGMLLSGYEKSTKQQQHLAMMHRASRHHGQLCGPVGAAANPGPSPHVAQV